ncbi:MAG: methylated-DNA--[protein]-cysteine S-methyltransferase [Lentisphaeria bacterium]
MPEYHILENSWGHFCLAIKQQQLCRLYIPGEILPEECSDVVSPLLLAAVRQLEEYLLGRRWEFDLPLAPQGTVFQQQVWAELLRIPYGETRSYQVLAEKIGKAKACRAVGMACHRNPLPIFIPCHRVIAKNGALQGFRGGLEMKERLLQLEKQ